MRMNDEINFKNNPLHGVSLKQMLVALVDHYGFEILFAYLNINCFKNNPSIQSGVKFLKRTDWAREKVENFYLYEFKNLPRASYDQFQESPRARIIPDDQKPGEPAELSLEDAGQRQKTRQRKAADFDRKAKPGRSAASRTHGKRGRQDRQGPAGGDRAVLSSKESTTGFNPWAKPKKS